MIWKSQLKIMEVINVWEWDLSCQGIVSLGLRAQEGKESPATAVCEDSVLRSLIKTKEVAWVKRVCPVIWNPWCQELRVVHAEKAMFYEAQVPGDRLWSGTQGRFLAGG